MAAPHTVVMGSRTNSAMLGAGRERPAPVAIVLSKIVTAGLGRLGAIAYKRPRRDFFPTEGPRSLFERT